MLWFFVAILVLLFGLNHFLGPLQILKVKRVFRPIPDSFKTTYESHFVSGFEGDKIKLLWVNGKVKTKGTMILIHGINSSKEIFLEISAHLAKMNLSSAIIDLRAHCESEGSLCTFGFRERHDLSAVIDFIHQKLPNQKIGIWGNSLGGSIALQSMAHDDRIAFGVITSTFRNYEEIVRDYVKATTKNLLPDFVIKHWIKRASQIGRFDLESIKPINVVKEIKKPLFFAHGNADLSIKFEYAQDLFEHAVSTDKQFYTVEGGDHEDLWEVGGKKYQEAIWGFIEKQF